MIAGHLLVNLKQANLSKTKYGIHGTRGLDGMFGHFVTPPMPQWMFGLFVDDDAEKYSYCSHGCIRISNEKIKELFTLVTMKGRKKPSDIIYIYIKR